MSAFDKLKSQAQKYLQDHPDQVEKGKNAVGDKLGTGGKGDGQRQGDRDQSGQDQDQDQGQGGQR
jgi:hypothetical protein